MLLTTVLHNTIVLPVQGKEAASMTSNDEESESTKDLINKIEDVLIKVIRVLANLSISEDVGPFIAANQQFMSLLLSIIGMSCMLV